MPFHTTWLSMPVVTLRPTVKISLRSQASRSSQKTQRPSGVSGRQAVREVPGYCFPLRVPACIWQVMTMVPGGQVWQRRFLSIWQVILPQGWSPVMCPKMVEQIAHLAHLFLPMSWSRQTLWYLWEQPSISTSSSYSLEISFSTSLMTYYSRQIMHFSSSILHLASSNQRVGKYDIQNTS